MSGNVDEVHKKYHVLAGKLANWFLVTECEKHVTEPNL